MIHIQTSRPGLILSLQPSPTYNQLHPRVSRDDLVIAAQMQTLQATQHAIASNVPFYPWHPWYSADAITEWITSSGIGQYESLTE